MFLQQKVNDINERIKVLKDVSNILIWGAGQHTCKLFEKTSILSYDVKHIVDMDRRKHGSFFFGFEIEDPEKILWDRIGAMIISVPGKEREISRKFKEHFSFAGEVIFLYEEKDHTPFYYLYDENVLEVCYLGSYNTWNDAMTECDGYDDSTIINKVIQSVESVLKGNAAWERDGYLFYEPKYVYPICAAVLRCAVYNRNKGKTGVRVLDIGGSLGSTYFQNKKYWSVMDDLEYVIAEQDNFYEYGHKHLEDKTLKFINSRDEFGIHGKFDIVLFSASLQYIPTYKEIMEKVMKINPCYIIFDRILIGEKKRICKELVPEYIYKSSYPVIIFSEEELIDLVTSDYEMIEKDGSSVPENAYFLDENVESRFYVFQRKNHG